MDASQYRQPDGTYLVPTPYGDPIAYREVGGVFYHAQTDPELITVLERARLARIRIKVTLGDPATGGTWDGVPEEGYINTSTGPIKVPLLLARSNSDAGGSLLDHCVVRVEYANKRDGGILWESKKSIEPIDEAAA